MIKFTAKGVGIILAIVAVMLAVGTAIMFMTGTIQKWTADWRGDRDATESIFADGGYRIAEYEQFYDRCYAVIELEAQIALAEEAVAGAAEGSWDQTELQRNLTALQNQRIELISAYNSDAAKEDTAANFHASDLPSELDIDSEETSCSAPASAE